VVGVCVERHHVAEPGADDRRDLAEAGTVRPAGPAQSWFRSLLTDAAATELPR
jgi:hypothetical protein